MCNRCEDGLFPGISIKFWQDLGSFWPDSELLPMNLTVGRYIYKLPTCVAQDEYSKSQNCSRKTEVKIRSLNILSNVRGFEEKSPLQKVMLPLSNRAKLLPQRTDNI